MDRTKTHLFRIITFLIAVAFFVLLETGLNLADYGERPALFVPASITDTDHQYLKVNPRIAERYFPKSGFFVPSPPYEHFLRNKPKRGYRIFVLGGSTAAGWPYPNNVLFSRILRQRLADTFSNREFEVINTGLAAVNSYTLLDFMDEVLAQQPDAVLIYAGHNEFYGALGASSTISLGNQRALVNLYLRLKKLRTFSLLTDIIYRARTWSSKSPKETHSTLMSKVVSKTNILLGSTEYQRGVDQFQGNLRDILEKAKEAGVPVVMSELVSNIRDHEPFVSEGTDTLLPADKVFQQARLLEAEGKLAAAREAYYRAKDLDAMRFRASEDVNKVIHQLAGEFGVSVVPMKSYMEAASPNGLIGNNLILEHLHPNVEGHFIMSRAFFDTMRRAGLIESNWDNNNILPDSYYQQNWGVTEIDRALGNIRIINLMDHWPFKPSGESTDAARKFIPKTIAERLAKKVFFNTMSFPHAHHTLAGHLQKQGKYELAVKEYKAAIAASPLTLKLYINAALSLLSKGQVDLAKPFLNESLKVKDSGVANKWLGLILLSESKPDEAIIYLEKATRLLPSDPKLLFSLGTAYRQTGQIDKARATFADLKKIESGSPVP
ncbi:tetratricopeptide repeat protein [Thermodesulfobacteriota bacterium]